MKYAIVECGGKQYKTVEGGLIDVDRLEAEAGQPVSLEIVLLLVEDGTVHVGTPTIDTAKVSAVVVEQFKGPKIEVFHYRPKKRIRVHTGHRQQYTRLKIEKIVME
jgi:large subunit ribosomal protein L21